MLLIAISDEEEVALQLLRQAKCGHIVHVPDPENCNAMLHVAKELLKGSNRLVGVFTGERNVDSLGKVAKECGHDWKVAIHVDLGGTSMFYNWRRIKVVMAELYDPEDETRVCGKAGLVRFYTRSTLCPAQVTERFVDLIDAEGEQGFQIAAAAWYNSIKVHEPKTIVDQVEDVLMGRKDFFQ